MERQHGCALNGKLPWIPTLLGRSTPFRVRLGSQLHMQRAVPRAFGANVTKMSYSSSCTLSEVAMSLNVGTSSNNSFVSTSWGGLSKSTRGRGCTLKMFTHKQYRDGHLGRR